MSDDSGLCVSDAERALLAKSSWSADELVRIAFIARRLAAEIPLPAIVRRRYDVARRLDHALEIHYLPDCAVIRAARERLREDLAREPADAEEPERLDYRSLALAQFEAVVAHEATT